MHNVKIERNNDGQYTEVSVISMKEGTARYSFKTEDEYKSPYLSEENLSYYVARNDEDEEDDYLLHHALQERKKLCATFWTRNVETIVNAFDKEEYNVAILDEFPL